ncbi:MAG TPA: choice-of-anchor D domain-containing protein, partial [Casimicrobiaceae bacterium]
SPASADFGAIAVATQSNTVTFTIKNSGASGTINSASSSNNTEFLVSGGSCLSAPPHAVAQNDSCTVLVDFKPSLAGSRSSTLTIVDNGTPNPLTVALTGTGSASAPAQPNLSVPPSASFGTQTLLVPSVAMALTIRNIGTATAIVNSVTSNSSEFAVTSSTCNGALVVNGTCTVDVAFDPTSSGARSATLTVSSNGIGSPQSIALSGTGAAAGGATGSGTKVTVVEYYDATFNHYFITSDLTEIGLLGKPPFADWQPTGLTFNGYSKISPPSGAVGICRFFNDHFLGTSTHFYAPHGFGCEATIADFPDWTLEDSQLFYAYVPDAAGNCQAGTIPVYRLYNNGMGGAPNHRFTISLAVRQTMLDKGYTPEGNGIGVGMCVPQ